MNRLFIFAGLVVLLLGTGSCCSKKGTCNEISFHQFEVINFPDSAIKGKIRVVTYDPKSLTQISSMDVHPEATGDPKVYSFKTDELDANHEYSVHFDTTGKEFRVNDFTASKISCGKCFMKTNNNFGYELAAYRVNNRGQKYDGVIRVFNN
jgi:hypothetical protein